MKTLLALATVCAVAVPNAACARQAKARTAQGAIAPISASFDLKGDTGRSAADSRLLREAIAVPKGMSTDSREWTPPSVELAVGEGGPVIAVGAMGSRRKGTPKLAHVALAWQF